MKRPVKYYLQHPIFGFGLFIKLIHKSATKNYIPKSKEKDIQEINNYVEKFKKNNYFDFNGLILTANGFNPDLFFNVIYPHLEGISYSKSEITGLYKKAKNKWKSTNFYADNFLFMVNQNAVVAHGVSYFCNECRIKPGDTVIDLGASPGDFAALSISHGAKKVYCFDPDKSSFLTETAELNNGKIEIVPKYVSDNNHNKLGITLDKFCSDNKIEHLDFIKMDIEGGELLAIEGAKESLKRFQPKMSICVYHDLSHSKKIQSLVKSISSNYKFETLGPVLYCIPTK